MKDFFNSKKIAVVGVSREKDKVGRIIFDNLNKSRALRVFPVNPKTNQVGGKETYKDVLSIPFPIDLAIIATPSKVVPKVLKQCGEKEIKNVIVVSSGFSEAGNNDLDKEIKEIIGEYGIRIIGPNVLGIINPYKEMNASFFREMPEKGSIGIISQSGAVGTSMLDKCLETGLGISGFASLGNMADVDFISSLEYFGRDVRTGTIVLYIESLKKDTGEKFVKLCKEISKKKNIIAINSGKTKGGEKAAKTHTASMTSPHEIYSGAFKQAGVTEVNSLKEALTLAQIFSKYGKLGNKGGIITNAGGLGVMAADCFSNSGINVSGIPEKILKQLDNVLPSGYSRDNPLDVLGDALSDRYEKVVNMLNMYKVFDFLMVVVSPQEMTQPMETARILTKRGKPVFACFCGGKSFKKAKEYLTEEGVVHFDDVEDAGRILGKAIK